MKKHILFLLVLIGLVSFVHTDANSQKRLNTIAKRGVLKVGMTGEQPPFSMEAKDGSLMGYEVNLAELLAESMNLELEIVRLPFHELMPTLEKGDIDMIMSGMSITRERNMRVAFVGPYIVSGKSIITKSASLAAAQEAEDLNQSDLKIASLKGSNSEQFVQKLLPDAVSLPAENYDMAVKSLIDGEANLVLADFPVCVITVLKYPNEDLVTLSEPLTIEPIGMALPPDDPLLLNFVENYFNALQMTGILEELEAYWFEDGSWLINAK